MEVYHGKHRPHNHTIMKQQFLITYKCLVIQFLPLDHWSRDVGIKLNVTIPPRIKHRTVQCQVITNNIEANVTPRK